ncbi:MAG: sensor histidine kinase, partial [Oscillospiraceae bacterium]
DIQCREELYPVYVNKLILQPLVENAIQHGIDKCGGGTVEINIYTEESDLVYEVKDSAALLDGAAVDRLLKNHSHYDGKSIGLRNVMERLHLHFGHSYGITYEIKDGCTVFSVRMPITDKKAEQE